MSPYSSKKVLPIWDEYFTGHDFVKRAVSLAEQYLETGESYEDIDSEASSMIGRMQNVQGLSDDELNASLAGHACVDALLSALGDYYCEEPDELDKNLDAWDVSVYSAGAYSGGFPWVDPPYRSDPDKLQEFWNWYLDEVEKLAL